MDYESSSDEGLDEEFPINQESHFPPSPNPKDHESSSDEGEALSPNPNYYESRSDEG